VCVVGVSSSAAEAITLKGGVSMDKLDHHNDKSPFYKYCVSKAGNYLQATEFAKKHRADDA